MSTKSKYFKLQELVSRAVFNKYGDSAWQFFDQKAIDTLDFIKENIKRTVIVNDWSFNYSENTTQYRGYRHENEFVGGAFRSAHKEGKAFDISVIGMTDEELEEWIIKNESKLPYKIRIEIEDTRTKVHFDVRCPNQVEKIKFFKP